MTVEIVEVGLAGLAVAAVSAPAVLSLLRHRHILDVPSVRSSHVEATPRGGGICCLLGALPALALASPLGFGDRGLFAAAAIGFGGLGLVDDVRHLPVCIRLVLQTAMAVLAAGWILHARGEPVIVAVVMGLLAVVWIVGYVNVFNFMDGINGLAACSAIVSGVTFAIIGSSRGNLALAVGGTMAAGVAAGFLPWNFPHARFFLGDVGSYLLGAWVAVLVVVAVTHHVPLEAALAPQALFVADAGWTLADRIWRGDNWAEAHRNHVYQQLHQLGWSHRKVTSLMALLMATTAALGAVSLTGFVALRAVADTTVIALLLGYLASPALLRRPQRIAAALGA
jgi:UDP-GlcNAc:undecaprenyl-phosphate GlcNAc-1-phosphate transferase